MVEILQCDQVSHCVNRYALYIVRTSVRSTCMELSATKRDEYSVTRAAESHLPFEVVYNAFS